jgi:putative SOS response-associated peptidase YedK
MCARYTSSTTSAEELGAEFDVSVAPPPLEPQYNIAPTEDAPVVLTDREGERRIVLARFGLVPHWAEDLKIGPRLLNARVESVADKPAYRDAFARHRCLVVADGFYEWRKVGRVKVPHYFHLPDHRPFGIAGVWAVWKDPKGDRVTSFSILTRDAEGAAKAIHDRMPVILARDAYGAWLDRELEDPAEILPLLEHHRGLELVGEEVSTRVNDVKNDGPDLVRPVDVP